eukprot:TRINITY_DN27096_c0_g2_i1.p1 TRINITY_DN27096_c0_g2~~TRINITY_DN27096_c0_g2_i1.p1  ORF type:complete len:380 (-),score=62.55 TRINITY_DN27096_c0_g2_i1:1083-2222(-)
MAGVVEGLYYLVRYNEPGPALYHERLALKATRDPGFFAIVTPDDDVYVESVVPNDDIADVVPIGRRGARGRLPADRAIYRFREDARRAAGYPRLVAEANTAVEEFEAGHDGFAMVGDADAARPAAGVELVDGEEWVYAENLGGLSRGDKVTRLEGAVCLGSRGVLPLPTGGQIFIRRLAVDDVEKFKHPDLRTLPIIHDGQGERRCTFSQAVQRMNDTEIEGGLLVVRPPRTALWTLKDMLQNGGDPVQHYEWWLRVSRVPEGDRASYEMEVLCRVLYAFCCVDQVNAPALSGIELIVRRISLIKEAHRLSPSSPDYSASDYFMGWGQRRFGATVAPVLAQHVAEELRADAAILKESRKAREERQQKPARGARGDKHDK